MRERSGHRERGAVAVEFALSVLFVILPLIVGGTHLGLVLATKHKLSDATGYAARAAAIAKHGDAITVRNLITARLGASVSDCTALLISSNILGVAPYTRLEVTATCSLPPPFGAAFLDGVVGPSSIAVTAAFPY